MSNRDESLDEWQRRVGEWAVLTFPQQTKASLLRHLREELDELEDAGESEEEQEEAADVAILLLALAHRRRFSLADGMSAKFNRLLVRRWLPPDEHGVVRHDKQQHVATGVNDSTGPLLTDAERADSLEEFLDSMAARIVDYQEAYGRLRQSVAQIEHVAGGYRLRRPAITEAEARLLHISVLSMAALAACPERPADTAIAQPAPLKPPALREHTLTAEEAAQLAALIAQPPPDTRYTARPVRRLEDLPVREEANHGSSP